jgi:hypothetical protein
MLQRKTRPNKILYNCWVYMIENGLAIVVINPEFLIGVCKHTNINFENDIPDPDFWHNNSSN